MRLPSFVQGLTGGNRQFVCAVDFDDANADHKTSGQQRHTSSPSNVHRTPLITPISSRALQNVSAISFKESTLDICSIYRILPCVRVAIKRQRGLRLPLDRIRLGPGAQ